MIRAALLLLVALPASAVTWEKVDIGELPSLRVQGDSAPFNGMCRAGVCTSFNVASASSSAPPLRAIENPPIRAIIVAPPPEPGLSGSTKKSR